MPLQSFRHDRRCPHCSTRGSLFLEDIWGELDLVCIVCGYRCTGIVPRRQMPAPPAVSVYQEALPLTT